MVKEVHRFQDPYQNTKKYIFHKTWAVKCYWANKTALKDANDLKNDSVKRCIKLA